MHRGAPGDAEAYGVEDERRGRVAAADQQQGERPGEQQKMDRDARGADRIAVQIHPKPKPTTAANPAVDPSTSED
jgi:hypothetical protein